MAKIKKKLKNEIVKISNIFSRNWRHAGKSWINGTWKIKSRIHIWPLNNPELLQTLRHKSTK
jgi:hypothetical protein